MTFAYQPRPIAPTKLVAGEVVYRPLVPVEVWGTDGAVGVWALADTGADHTLLPASLAEHLGVRLDEPASRVQGFGGQSLTVVPGNVDLKMTDGQQWFDWAATVGFVQFDQLNDEIVVLGHKQCLEFFRVTFDGERRVVEFVPTPEFPGVVSGPR